MAFKLPVEMARIAGVEGGGIVNIGTASGRAHGVVLGRDQLLPAIADL